MLRHFISWDEVEISKFSSFLFSLKKKGEKKTILELWSNSGWRGPLKVIGSKLC